MTAILDLPATEALRALNEAKAYYAHLCRLADMEHRHHIDLCDLVENYSRRFSEYDDYEDLRQQVVRQAIICEGIEEHKAKAHEALSAAYKDYYVAMGWKAVNGVIRAAMKQSLMPPQARGAPDKFQTPPKALDPLYPYFPKRWKIWECACGDSSLAYRIAEHGYDVFASDVDNGWDFLTIEPPPFDAIITNPPFSIKDKFIARCYELGKPWALLMPITALGGQKRQAMYRKYGVQIIMLGKRLQFIAPPAKGAWQEHAWFTWGLDLPNDIVFARLD